jgi:cellulose synthase (UDP-forming)
MQVLRRENPLLVPGLSIAQRLAYAATLLGWFDAWRSLGYLILPVIVLLTGAVPIRADPATFILFFGATFVLGQLALRLLSRGCHRSILSIAFELVRMTPNIAATLTLVSRRGVGFRVTPKGRTGDARRPAPEPPLLRLCALFSLFGLAWFALTLLGGTPTRYEIPWAAYATAGWLVLNVILIVSAIRRVRSLRFAGERRASHRFQTVLQGRIDGAPCEVHDLSLTGARVELEGLPDLDTHVLAVPIDGGEVVLDAVSRSTRRDGAKLIIGLEFLPGQDVMRARLALQLFETRLSPADVMSPDSRPTRPFPEDAAAA